MSNCSHLTGQNVCRLPFIISFASGAILFFSKLCLPSFFVICYAALPHQSTISRGCVGKKGPLKLPIITSCEGNGVYPHLSMPLSLCPHHIMLTRGNQEILSVSTVTRNIWDSPNLMFHVKTHGIGTKQFLSQIRSESVWTKAKESVMMSLMDKVTLVNTITFFCKQ